MSRTKKSVFFIALDSFLGDSFSTNVAFPPTLQPHLRVIEYTKTFRCYFYTAALIGLVFPFLYILVGILTGDRAGIKGAAPHLFLLSCQVLMERFSFHRGFSSPVIAFVPVFYNSRRIFTLIDWLKAEIRREEGSSRRLFMGRALAVINMGFWSYNLFCFLIPVYIPRIMKKYYAVARANS